MISYFEFEAKSHYDLGFQIGQKLKTQIQKRHVVDSNPKIEKCLELCKKHVPEYVEELKGLAGGADVAFEQIFHMNCQDYTQRCTTAVFKLKNKYFVAHNEDWWEGDSSDLYVAKITLGSQTILGLGYACELLGSAICMSSTGIVQAVNSLAHKNNKIGIPKNFVARKILDSQSTSEVADILQTLPRASGYNHIIAFGTDIYNIESTADKIDVQKITAFPFVHTNHYLGTLRIHENWTDSGTYNRLKLAQQLAPNVKTQADIWKFLIATCNEETKASVVIPLAKQSF